MTRLSEERHVARNWVEANYPDVKGNLKAILILTFGAGLDRGLSEAQEMADDLATEIRADNKYSVKLDPDSE